MKRTVIISTLFIACIILLSACGREAPVSAPDDESYQKHKHEFVYYEVLNNVDEDYPKVDIAYKEKGKLKHIYTNLDYVYEHIIEDETTPFFVKDGKDIHVYRPPYMTFGDDSINGEVVDKDEVSGDR